MRGRWPDGVRRERKGSGRRPQAHRRSSRRRPPSGSAAIWHARLRPRLRGKKEANMPARQRRPNPSQHCLKTAPGMKARRAGTARSDGLVHASPAGEGRGALSLVEQPNTALRKNAAFAAYRRDTHPHTGVPARALLSSERASTSLPIKTAETLRANRSR